jgi:hypothetical protein
VCLPRVLAERLADMIEDPALRVSFVMIAVGIARMRVITIAHLLAAFPTSSTQFRIGRNAQCSCLVGI